MHLNGYLLIALGVLMVVAVLHPLWLGEFYATGDMRDIFIPLELFFQKEQLAGRMPSWYPDVSWGFPVIAAGQIGFFYPPLLLTRWLPIQFYLPLLLVIHTGAALAGMYIFLRRLSISPFGAFFGSLSFAFSSFTFQHLTHLNIFLILAWLPWQFVAANAGASQRSWRRLSLLCLTLAIPFLNGQFQLPLLMAAITTAYFFYRSRQNRHPLPATLCFILGLMVGVAGLSAAQMLPTLELVGYSSRADAEQFDLVRANQHSFPFYHLPTLFFPRFFGNDYTYWGKRLEIEYGIFVGTIPLLLSLWLVTRRHTHLPLSFWGWLGLSTFLFALGDWSPFRLVGIEPSLWFFSAPARWLLFTTFALAIITAYAFDYLKQNSQSFYRFCLRVSLLLGLGVLSANIFLNYCTTSCQSYLLQKAARVSLISLSDTPADYYVTKINDLINQAKTNSVSFFSPFTYLPLIIVASLLILTRRYSQRYSLILLALTMGELGIVAATTSPTVSWRETLSPPLTIEALPPSIKEKQARLLSRHEGGDTGALFTNPASRADDQKRRQQKNLLLPLMHAQFNLAGVQWPASLDLQEQAKTLEALQTPDDFGFNLEQAANLNVGAMLVPASMPQPPNLKPYQSIEGINIYELPAVSRASVLDNQNQELPTVKVEYKSLTPTHTRLTVDTPQSATVIIRDTWYPGWQATLQGQSLPVQFMPPFWQKLSVPAGHHQINLQYHSTSLRYGLIISLVTTILLTIGVFRPKKFR